MNEFVQLALIPNDGISPHETLIYYNGSMYINVLTYLYKPIVYDHSFYTIQIIIDVEPILPNDTIWGNRCVIANFYAGKNCYIRSNNNIFTNKHSMRCNIGIWMYRSRLCNFTDTICQIFFAIRIM
ncbi:hypothetical protein SDC9_133761 [bioreactor metagenome]|uniref:Uncharacterized protein n=1 Tax=bioreactor metagenome TaxID=1076179 RepID=A0A645DB40_9ZZZZ